jgi:AmiR/NasT family two-component response regulator
MDESQEQSWVDRASAARLQSAALRADHAAAADGFAGAAAMMTTMRAELEQARARIENLEKALATNRHIGMAIGIIMARMGLTEQAAFDALRDVSQREHRKLRDVAEDVLLTGELPPAA